MLLAVRGDNGERQAKCICDDCGAVECVPAQHGNRDNFVKGTHRNGVANETLLNEGKVHAKLQNMGWSHIRNRLRCEACTAKRKEKPEVKPMTASVQDLRRPTREQKRQIIDLLTDVYDTAAERYKGCETDVTVAAAIGGGCMFGWVAEIRDELFGPEGVNEEAVQVIAELRVWQETADALMTKAHAAIEELEGAREKVGQFQKRLDAIVKSHGPRAKVAM